MSSKLEFRIIGRRKLENDAFNLEYVDVEWYLADGGQFTDYERRPVTHPPNIQYQVFECGKRDVIADCIAVKEGTKDSIVMQLCEEKREQLEKSIFSLLPDTPVPR